MLNMKTILIFCAVLFTTSTFAQRHLEVLSYEDTQKAEVFQTVKDNTTLSSYIAADGSVLRVGDTLIIGVPTGSTTKTVGVGGAGEGFGVGSARSKTKNSFSTIIKGRPVGVGNIISIMNGEGKNMAGQEFQGERVVIMEMEVNHKGSKKKPLALTILLGEPNGRAFGINKYLSVVDYEKAVLAGEVKSLNAPLSREEAIAKLRESKDLLDLGLIQEAEYLEIKERLTPVIMTE